MGVMRDRHGERNPNWKGGRRVHTKGYIECHRPGHPRAQPNGCVLEHILVMEAHLGRALAEDECVHHKDENKQNNDIKNLVVMKKGAHSRHHHPHKDRLIDVDKAVEMLQEGGTPKEVAQYFGVSSKHAVYRALHRAGRAAEWVPDRSSKYHKEVDWDSVQQSLNNGATIAAAAACAGISRTAIYAQIKKGRLKVPT